MAQTDGSIGVTLAPSSDQTGHTNTHSYASSDPCSLLLNAFGISLM